MGAERRRKPRHRASHWTGRYRLSGASAWRECELVEVSASGAGFQAYILPTDVRLGAEVEIELVDEVDPTPDPVRLGGAIRHLTRSDAGHVRVGMEFAGLSDLEACLLAMLFRRDALRARPTRVEPRVAAVAV
jgi:hypothetical protein